MATYKEEQNLLSLKTRYAIRCSCGKTTTIYPFENRNKKICKWCGHYVYMKKEEQFKETLKRLINENK